MPRRVTVLVIPLLALALTPPAVAQRTTVKPILHEPIFPDPREDLALSVTLEGDLPAAIETPRGLVAAPDPARPFGKEPAPYGASPQSDVPGDTFRPDRDTSRPDALPYDDPFSPSTAPFKRLSAFDSVGPDYTLSVRHAHTTPLPISASPSPAALEARFYADMVVDLMAGKKVRIPSVGPGARVLRARAGVGTQDVKFSLFKDGADNWFIEGETSTRARLVMELAIPRAAFGGDFGNPTRAQIRGVPPLPHNVQEAAAQVSRKIGVTPRTPPREVVTKLVNYFRAFRDSEERLAGGADIYLDLALQQRGVCRHRSFAFLVTALYLGIPTRMVTNEAHAWVEVDDGNLWRRIDLGGAGRALEDPLSSNVRFDPPPDPFTWPEGSARGDDLGRTRRTASNDTTPPGAPSSSAGRGASDSNTTAAAPQTASHASDASSQPNYGPGGPLDIAPHDSTATATDGVPPKVPDDRPPSEMTMTLLKADPHRGAPFPIRGQVTAQGQPCRHVSVEVVLRSASHGDIPIGVVATDERGIYDGAVVLPTSLPLGDYEAYGRTTGDVRCGAGRTQ